METTAISIFLVTSVLHTETVVYLMDLHCKIFGLNSKYFSVNHQYSKHLFFGLPLCVQFGNSYLPLQSFVSVALYEKVTWACKELTLCY